jgi:O-antigen ligase
LTILSLYRQSDLSAKDTVENKISYFHLLLFLMMLPFDRFYSEIILISFSAHTLIHLTKSKLSNLLKFPFIVLSSIFLAGLVGVIYSSDKNQALNDLERQFAIFLLPALFSLSSLNFKLYRDSLLKGFGISCTVTIAYLFVYAIRTIQFNNLPPQFLFNTAFLNHNFSAPIDLHATYMSMYVALSLFAFLYFVLHEKNQLVRILYILAIVVLVAGLMQLASRAVFIATAFIIAVLYPLLALERINRLRFLLATIALLFIAIIGIYRIDSLKERFIIGFKNDLTQTSINNELLEPRAGRWEIAWNLIQQSPVIGHGSGSEKRLMLDEYFKHKLYNSYLNRLNAHNEYLSMWLKTGIWGLLVFLLTLVYGFVIAFRNRDLLFASFMTLIAVVSFSENIMDVNKTVFFYAFFFSLFIFSSPPDLVPTNIFKPNKRVKQQ